MAQSDQAPFSFRPLFRELSNSLNGLGLQRREEEAGPSGRAALDRRRPPPLTPPPVPNTSILDKEQQIVVGVLLKYVNLAAGWHPRLFVLQGGVLRYYKVHGSEAVDVHLLLEALRRQGELFPIGAEVALLEARDQRAARVGAAGAGASSRQQGGADYSGGLPEPKAEVHAQVSHVKLSNSDGRKFYVHSGTATLTLRAETMDDRWVWAEGIRAAKGAWDGLTPTAAAALRRDWAPTPGGAVQSEGAAFEAQLAAVRQCLASAKVDLETRAFVEDTLVEAQNRSQALAAAEESKRRALLELVYSLENDKRQLETALVVEGRSGTENGGVGGAATGSTYAKALALSGDGAAPLAFASSDSAAAGEDGSEPQDSLPTGDEEDELEGIESLRREAEAEEEQDEFYDSYETLSVRGAHSREGSIGDLVALEAHTDGTAAAAPQAVAAPAAAAKEGVAGVGAKYSTAPNHAWQRLPADNSAVVPAPQPAAHCPEVDWLASEGPSPPRRSSLPPPAQAEKSVSLWSLIKEMVGRDLTRVCLPVYFNEPLSALQKTAEDLEYSELLDEAAALPPTSPARLLRVAAFAVSAYSSTVGRTAKPFNPLLGETYELVMQEKGFRFLAEKVSHHPTIIAARAEGRGWVFEGDAEVRSKFWGRSIELRPEGVLRLTFADGDSYAWNKVTTSINNLILGKIYVDHGGIMWVRCLSPAGGGLAARIRFKETGVLFDKDPRQVRGFLERGGQRLERPVLHGHWDEALFADEEGGALVELWRKAPPPAEPTRYNLTSFAIRLNEVTPGIKEKLAPTDCRLRPDQAFTELGMWDEANVEKQRLEHKQRAARRAAERGDPLHPRWFAVLPAAGSKQQQQHRAADELAFAYCGSYWEQRAAGQFTGCRDIFGPVVGDA